MFKKYDYYISELINAHGQPVINRVDNNIRNNAHNILVDLFDILGVPYVDENND